VCVQACRRERRPGHAPARRDGCGGWRDGCSWTTACAHTATLSRPTTAHRETPGIVQPMHTPCTGAACNATHGRTLRVLQLRHTATIWYTERSAVACGLRQAVTLPHMHTRTHAHTHTQQMKSSRHPSYAPGPAVHQQGRKNQSRGGGGAQNNNQQPASRLTHSCQRGASAQWCLLPTSCAL
jgi:hypothetical protein